MIKELPQPIYITTNILSPIMNNCGEIEPEVTLALLDGLDTFKTSYMVLKHPVTCVTQNNAKPFKFKEKDCLDNFLEIYLN